MKEYLCSRCNYKTNNKAKFRRHLQRKIVCDSVNKNISVDEIYKKTFGPEILQNTPNLLQKSTSITPITPFLCDHCGSSFTRKFNLERHLKRCKKLKNFKSEKKVEKEKLKNKLRKEIMEEIQKDKIIIEKEETPKVKLNPFSETDRSHLTDKDYLMAIKKGNMGLAYIIQKIHFNEDKPENHNICMTNTKNGLVKIYTKANGWEHQLANETVNFLVEDNANIIEDKISEWKRVDDPEDELKNKIEQSDKKLLNDIVDEIYDSSKSHKKHQILEEDVINIEKSKIERKPKHKYGGDKYSPTLEKFPRLLDRLSTSNYVRKLVHDQVKLVLYNKRGLALKAERDMKKLSTRF